MQFPVAYFERNLAFTPSKECWAVYELPGHQYDFGSTDHKKRVFRRLLGLLWGLEQDYRILQLPEIYTYEDHFEKLKARITGPFTEYAHSHADQTKAWLEDMGGKENSKHRIFIAINITKEKGLLEIVRDAKSFFRSIFKEPVLKAEQLLGLSGIDILEDELRVLLDAEERLYNRISKYIRLDRVNESRIEWQIRRNFWKGIGAPPKRYLWQSNAPNNPLVEGAYRISTGRKNKDVQTAGQVKVVRSRYAEYMNLSEGHIFLDDDSRCVKITQDVGGELVFAYSAYLTISEFPDDLNVPGSEFLYMLHDIGFPVAASVYVSPMSSQEAREKVQTKMMDIDDQQEHTADAVNDMPLNLQESKSDALGLEKDLADAKFPMLDASFVFEVVAPTKKELWERVDAIKDYFKDMNFELVNPAGDQWYLFNEFFPVGPRMCSNDYVHRISPHVLAASMFAASKQLGDDEGFYVGTTGVMHQPVFLDPSSAPRRNMSGSVAALGTLGGGKSYTINLIGYNLVINGAKGLVIDPKGDRRKWQRYLVELGDQLEFVKFSTSEEYYGKLDPWGICRDRETAAEVALNIICFLARIRLEDEAFDDLTEAIEAVKYLNKPSMMEIVKHLESMSGDSAKKLARKLRAFSKMPYGKMIFHDGDLQSLNLDRRLTVLEVANLDLPDSGTDPEEYTPSNVLSLAMMMALAAYATEFTEENPEEFTFVIWDEFWHVSHSREGKRLATRLIRTGRSFYAAIFIITQNANDLLDETIKNNLGYKFIFRSEDNDEVTNILKFLDLELTQENFELIKNLENGKPLLRDLDGRYGIVDIDVVFSHLHMAFDTTPGKQEGEAV